VVAQAQAGGDHYICTRFEVVDGIFTGRPVEPICYGPGKLHWARIYARERDLDLSTSYFYTDSYTDLAMLQAVACPVAVNPDARLRRHAQKQGWPIERFF
jgi:phosphoserine phosphatase